ncbi:MAG: molecular chaperone DnaJ [Bdellovibrionales bacterium]
MSAAKKKDYYETLGCERGADADTLKKAFRKLAMQCHPDKNPGDKAAEAKFKEINEAYDVLRDEQRRAAYDRFGHAAFEQGGPGGFGGAGRGGFDFGAGFADVFEEMFGDIFSGGRGGRGQTARGADVRADLELTLEEAFTGTAKEIRVRTQMTCETCTGTGATPGTKTQTCGTCNGAGKQRLQQGFFMIERTCPTCQGAGQVITDPCRQCNGTGRQTKDRRLEVTVPAGVEDGTRIRLSGEGEAGARGAPPGDLYVFLGIKPHLLFQRDGRHIFCRVPLPLSTAALGGTIKVPTIDGSRVELTIPAGTQNGQKFRLKGKGMSILVQGRKAAQAPERGDMQVEAYVEVPTKMTKRQKELMEEFARESGHDAAHPESTDFWSRVKDIWKDVTE